MGRADILPTNKIDSADTHWSFDLAIVVVLNDLHSEFILKINKKLKLKPLIEKKIFLLIHPQFCWIIADISSVYTLSFFILLWDASFLWLFFRRAQQHEWYLVCAHLEKPTGNQLESEEQLPVISGKSVQGRV